MVQYIMLAAAAFPAAMPFQISEVFGLPWWVWLVVIGVLLLLAFAIILTFDWGDAAGREQNSDE